MDRAAISDQVDRILRSQSFASKSQLRKLLEVLFQNIDTQTALKPDRVIRELWPNETKTKGSADVATEMNRLRHALESYYDGEGKSRSHHDLPSQSCGSRTGWHAGKALDRGETSGRGCQWIATCKPGSAADSANDAPAGA